MVGSNTILAIDNKAALVRDSGVTLAAEPVDSAFPADDDRFPFTLITGNHLFYSGRLTEKSDILGGLLKEPEVEISEDDAEKLGFSRGDKVRVEGKRHSALLTLKTKRGSKNGVAFIAENFKDVAVNRFFEKGHFKARVKINRA